MAKRISKEAARVEAIQADNRNTLGFIAGVTFLTFVLFAIATF